MVGLLNAADLEAVLADFGKCSLEKNPVVHFSETFLTGSRRIFNKNFLS
jgi:hypothetical protein